MRPVLRGEICAGDTGLSGPGVIRGLRERRDAGGV